MAVAAEPSKPKPPREQAPEQNVAPPEQNVVLPEIIEQLPPYRPIESAVTEEIDTQDSSVTAALLIILLILAALGYFYRQEIMALFKHKASKSHKKTSGKVKTK